MKIPPKDEWNVRKHRIFEYPIYEFVVSDIRQDEVNELYNEIVRMGYKPLMMTENEWTVKSGKLRCRVARPEDIDKAWSEIDRL